MASAANGIALTTTEIPLFNSDSDGGKCTSFKVSNRADSTDYILVNVPGLHKTGEYIGIAPGYSEIFRLNNNGIYSVTAKSAGSSTVDYGVVAKS